MADGEREFKIRITGDAAGVTAASKQAGDSLAHIPESWNKASAAGVQGTKQVVKEVESAHVSHRQWRDMVRGLKTEFPELYHIAHMALHPIGLAVAGITAAWAIWTYRIKEAVSVMAGAELPDIKAFDPGHINAMTAAWDKYGEAVKRSLEELNSVEHAADSVIKKIEAALARKKELMEGKAGVAEARIDADLAAGKISPAEAAKRKLALQVQEERDKKAADFDARAHKLAIQEDEALALRKDAAKKKAEAAKIGAGSADHEARTLENLDAQAKAAEEDMKTRKERMGQIGEYQTGEMGFWRRQLYLHQYSARYGTGIGEVLPFDKARQMEQEGIDADRRIIERRDAAFGKRNTRAEQRAERERLFGAAAKEEGQAAGLEMEAASARGELGKDVGAGQVVSLLSEQKRILETIAEQQKEASHLREEMSGPAEKGQVLNPLMVQNLQATDRLIDYLIGRLHEVEQRLNNQRNHP